MGLGAIGPAKTSVELVTDRMEITRVKNGFIVTIRNNRMNTDTFVAKDLNMALAIIGEEVK